MTISKRALAIAVALVIALAVAAYFVAFSAKSSQVSLTVGTSSLSSLDLQTAEGTVAPAKAGRLVIVEARSEGAWTELGRATTDADGSYALEFAMTDRGEVAIRARVVKEGRFEQAVSASTDVAVLEPSQVEVRVPASARTDKALKLSGRVIPAGVRTVRVETSSDGQKWTAVGTSESSAGGQFTVLARDLLAGPTMMRVSVEASDTTAATSSTGTEVAVEDYKAAGKRYLAIVTPANNLLDKWDEVNVDGVDVTDIQKLSRELSKAYTKEARNFRDYAYWPAEIQQEIELLARGSVLRADFYHRLAKAESIAEGNELAYPSGPKGAATAPVVIREALGLPKRD
ncbi:MAG TPA: hypothetical protein VNS46_08495 [Nocardioides sp.]|nr:hypothetical protein [Nocardioides sp.]